MPKKAVRAAIRMALLSKFQDGQAIVLDGLSLAKPKTKEVARHLPGDPPARLERGRGRRVGRRDQGRGPRRGPSSGAPSCSACPAHDPVLHSQRPQHRGGQGRPGGRVQHLRHPEAALPGPDPRGARDLKERVKQQARAPPQRPRPPRAATRSRGAPRRADTMVTLRRPPQYRAVRPGAGAVPGHHPAPDHREGDPPLGAAQRLHLRGQPAGHQDRDQDGRSRPCSTSRSPTSAPRTAAASPAATGSRSAGCGTGRRPSSRFTRNTGSTFIESQRTGQALRPRAIFSPGSDPRSDMKETDTMGIRTYKPTSAGPPELVGQRLRRADRQEQEAREEPDRAAAEDRGPEQPGLHHGAAPRRRPQAEVSDHRLGCATIATASRPP